MTDMKGLIDVEKLVGSKKGLIYVKASADIEDLVIIYYRY